MDSPIESNNFSYGLRSTPVKASNGVHVVSARRRWSRLLSWTGGARLTGNGATDRRPIAGNLYGGSSGRPRAPGKLGLTDSFAQDEIQPLDVLLPQAETSERGNEFACTIASRVNERCAVQSRPPRLTSWPTMTLRWISLVPSPTIIRGASRK